MDPRRLIVLAVALGLPGCAAQKASSTASSLPADVQAARSSPSVGGAADARNVAPAAARLSLITEPQSGIAPILQAISGASRQVEMVMYEDVDAQVDAALAADEHRGVAVRVLLSGGYFGADRRRTSTRTSICALRASRFASRRLISR